MAHALRVGLDAVGTKAYFAAVERIRGVAVLRAAGVLEGSMRPPRALLGVPARVALAPAEALVSALPGVAIEEAEEAFRWEVAKSGGVLPDAERAVIRRAVGQDPGPPFLGFAGDPIAASNRSAGARAAGFTPAAVIVEALAFERLLVAARKLPTRGTILHVDVREGTSVLSAFGGGGLALRRTVRSAPVSAENLAIDVQRSASYAERKLTLPPCEAVYFTGEAVDPALIEAVSRGLPGLTVEALDPLTLVELDPRLDATAVGAVAYALALPIGLALLADKGPPDFLPRAERDGRSVRRAIERLRASALVLAPAVLALGLLADVRGAPARARLAEAEAKVAKVERIEKRTSDFVTASKVADAWQALLRSLGDRERRVSDLLVATARVLPGEAYLTEVDVKGRGEEFDVRIRGELVAADPSVALSAREPLRKAANEIAPGAQVVSDTTRLVQGRVRIGFSIDGTAPATAPKREAEKKAEKKDEKKEEKKDEKKPGADGGAPAEKRT